MKRTDIPNMSAQECADELTLMEIKKLIQKARKAQQHADECIDAVFNSIEDMCIELTAHSDAENADTLEEAICCYIHYGEYGLKNIMKEIRAQYCKDDKDDKETN